MTVTVYSRPDCQPCIATKRALQARGIPYREIDLAADQDALARFTAEGHRSAPVVEAEGQVWSGFRPDLIAQIAVRRGDWMQTATGHVFWPMDPRPDEVHIEDIAHALSKMCRYAGHCLTFYSVAQHSVLVARALPDDLKLWGLLHDASEAYLVDVPRPVKRFLPGYAEAEDRVMAAVCERFGLPADMPAEVKRVDEAILADEMAQIMLPPPRPWGLKEPPLGIEIQPWSPTEAHVAFLKMFETVGGR